MTAIPAIPIQEEVRLLLEKLGVQAESFSSGDLAVRTPITGEVIARIPQTSSEEVAAAIATAHHAFLDWQTIPAPKRGELVRLLGEELRENLPALGRLVTIETGKILSEGCGEVQEMIDICGFAAGLSRQLAGLTLTSERPAHRMMETWHPLGVVGIISAFNLPVAV
jgi:aldehyde dehydrogenase (NAD+)